MQLPCLFYIVLLFLFPSYSFKLSVLVCIQSVQATSYLASSILFNYSSCPPTPRLALSSCPPAEISSYQLSCLLPLELLSSSPPTHPSSQFLSAYILFQLLVTLPLPSYLSLLPSPKLLDDFKKNTSNKAPIQYLHIYHMNVIKSC